MELHLDVEESVELTDLLDSALGDLSHEIAGTDNASFRTLLRRRRDVLHHIRDSLGRETLAVAQKNH